MKNTYNRAVFGGILSLVCAVIVAAAPATTLATVLGVIYSVLGVISLVANVVVAETIRGIKGNSKHEFWVMMRKEIDFTPSTVDAFKRIVTGKWNALGYLILATWLYAFLNLGWVFASIVFITMLAQRPTLVRQLKKLF